MAYIPDLAIEQSSDLTPAAFRLYCHICRRRNHKYGNAIIVPATTALAMELSTSQIYRALDELRAKSWIVQNHQFVTPVLGDFSPVAPMRKDVAPMQKTVAPMRQEFAPVQIHIKDEPALNQIDIQPLEKPRLKKGKCKECTDGLWHDPHTGKMITCWSCDKGAQLRNQI